MPGKLEGKRIAIVVTDGFEQDELKKPKWTLESEGARCDVIAPGTKGFVKGWNHTDWGDSIDVDVPIAEAEASDYDALLLPGGTMNPDKLRLIPEVKNFVRSFFAAAKPVAAICHAPWLLIDVGVVEGRKMTSWPSLQTDLVNAGAEWVDEPVVVDQGLVTSRKPGDLPIFGVTLVEEFAREAPSAAQRRARSGRPKARPSGDA